MKIKKGVKQEGVQPALWFGLGVAEAIWHTIGRQLTVTSLNDSTHSANSRHYNGLAADIRTRDLTPLEVKAVMQKLVAILDPLGFDVVLEKDHIHLEVDAKPGEAWQQETT